MPKMRRLVTLQPVDCGAVKCGRCEFKIADHCELFGVDLKIATSRDSIDNYRADVCLRAEVIADTYSPSDRRAFRPRV